LIEKIFKLFGFQRVVNTKLDIYIFLY